MATERILVLEDDPDILDLTVHALRKAGYRTFAARTGSEALSILSDERLELAILDVMLPGASGYDICKQLRAKKVATPILMLTAKGQEIDKVIGSLTRICRAST